MGKWVAVETRGHATSNPDLRQSSVACDLLEEFAGAFDGGWEGGEEGGGDVVTEDELALLANQIHLLMDSAPIKSNGETIPPTVEQHLMQEHFQIMSSWMSIGWQPAAL